MEGLFNYSSIYDFSIIPILLKGLKIQKNQHDALNLQRDLLYSATALGIKDHTDEEQPNLLSHYEEENSYWSATHLGEFFEQF